MIKDITIQAVYDLDLVSVIQKYIDLKKKGANYMGKSPFTEEKTGSFSVSIAKNCYKCFSTGIGGGSGIKFLQQYKNLSFPEAVRELATEFNIQIEYDDSEEAKRTQSIREEQQEIADVNAFALEYFCDNFDPKKNELQRLSNGTIDYVETYSIGYAPDDWTGLYKFLLSKGVSESLMLKSGLIKKSDKGTFDFFRDRVVFPIYNRSGLITGFSGKYIGKDPKAAKYLNSSENILFNKSKALMGIQVAKADILKTGTTTLVEGNFDIVAMNDNGFTNTIASAGTAFTEHHAKELVKMRVTELLISFDGDEAGSKAALKAIKIATNEGLITKVLSLPDGLDPYDYFNDAERPEEEDVNDFICDGISFYTDKLFENAKSVAEQTKAEEACEDFLSLIKDHKLRKNYLNAVAKKHKLNKTELEKGLNVRLKEMATEDEDDLYRFPRKMTVEEKKEYEDQVKKYNFYEDTSKNKMGYWFLGQYKNFEMVSNFLIKPLFHIYSHTNNRRLVEIKNKDKAAIIEVPSKGFVNISGFTEECINHINAHWLGTPKQFKYVALKFMDKMPTAIEITTLGWQLDGFFAFADGIILDGNFKKVDDYGMVTIGSNSDHYFLPAFSKIYRDFIGQDDPYESDRAFQYQKSEITFTKWSTQYHKVHGDNGMVGISTYIAGLFSDHIHAKMSFFPILYNFGDIQTGKSEAARGLNAVLLPQQSGFSLHTGTLPALNKKFAQFRNVPVWLEEYSNDIDEKIFQALKPIWDRTAREKSKYSSGTKTTRDRILTWGIMTGQYMATRDSNSLLSRQIVCEFDVKAEDRSSEEMQELTRLKEMEEQGLSHIITEVLKYRDFFTQNFTTANFETVKEMKIWFAENEIDYSGRVMNNFAVVITTIRLLEDKIKLSFTAAELLKVSYKMIAKQSEAITDSDVLASYWKIVEFLFLQGMIKNGEDFKVVNNVKNERFYTDGKKTAMMDFPQDKNLIYIQFKKIQPLYMEAHKKQYGQNGTNESSIRSYMRSHKAFVGVTPTFQFNELRTSAWVFNYNMLDLDLLFSSDPNSRLKRAKNTDGDDDLPF